MNAPRPFPTVSYDPSAPVYVAGSHGTDIWDRATVVGWCAALLSAYNSLSANTFHDTEDMRRLTAIRHALQGLVGLGNDDTVRAMNAQLDAWLNKGAA